MQAVARILHLRSIRQQLRKLISELLGVTELLSKQGTSLVEELLEATTTAVPDILLTCTLAATVLEVLVGLLGHNMLISDCHDLLALLAMPVLTTVEEETE